MSPRRIKNPDEVWGEWFSGNAFAVDKRLMKVFRTLPRDPSMQIRLELKGIVEPVPVRVARGS